MDISAELAEIVAEVGPRRAALITETAAAVAAEIRADATALGPRPVTSWNRHYLRLLGSLPPATFAQGQSWRLALADAAERLGADARLIGAPVPRCSGEEMMLHIILQRASRISPGGPDDWADLFEILFQDHDILLLYDMPAEAAETAIDAANLRVEEWFTEFDHPYTVPTR